MGRKSKKNQITTAVRTYLARTEQQSPDQVKLDVKQVATALGVSRTTLYKYDLTEEIQTAAQRQQQRWSRPGQATKRSSEQDLVQQLRTQLQQAEARNKTLLAQLNLVEANAARLGLDPEDLYRPVPKPARTVPP